MNHGTNQIKVTDLLHQSRALPKSMLKAAGLLKGRKKVNPLTYQRQLRKEWERRFNKLSR